MNGPAIFAPRAAATRWFAALDARDRAFFARCVLGDEASHLPRRVWTVLTMLGGATCSILAGLAAWVLGHGQWRIAGRDTLIVLVTSHLAVQVLKRSIGRPRPSRGTSYAALIGEPDRFSFPSGHSAAALSVAIGFGFAFPAFAPLALGLAMLAGFSRVVLGVHYPGDVVAGQALALLSAILFIL
jgi:undecaprenyl-diphosphatase